MGENTDPRALGLAAGSSGGQYGFMQVGLSDKAAKDYSKAMTSIERSGKSGVFMQMIELYEKMIDCAGLMQPFIDFLTLFSNMMSGAFAESLAALYEGLFSDHNIANMEKAAELGRQYSEGLAATIKLTFDAIEAADKWGASLTSTKEHVEAFNVTMEKWEESIYEGDGILAGAVDAVEDWNDWVRDLNNSISLVTLSTEEWKDILDILKFPSLGGGGDDDDDDNPWYDPWGVLG